MVLLPPLGWLRVEVVRGRNESAANAPEFRIVSVGARTPEARASETAARGRGVGADYDGNVSDINFGFV